MKLNISDLKNIMTKINLAVEKSKLNPKSGWIELETIGDVLSFKVSNYDYYLQASVNIPSDNLDAFHVTVLAETFIPLVSKLDADYINIYEKLNSLIIETDSSSYTFPIIKELGRTKTIDKIEFSATSQKYELDANDISSVATVNTKGLVDAMFTKEIQQYIYVDNLGAITFTENIYVNDFNNIIDDRFKMLLNITQSKLLEVFKDSSKVIIEFEQLPTYNNSQTLSNKVCLSTDNLKLILITQPMDIVDTFPSIRLRALSSNPEQSHVIIDKKILDKALTRLMVFDKKFDITVMDYSKLIFRENELELVSIKNKNFEKIPYISCSNVEEHESIIRFADLVKQLKAITSKEIDISYGQRPAIVINSNVKQVIPEIRVRDNRI